MLSQQTALEVLRCGVNAFLTGEPGSGKTYTLDAYLRWLRARQVARAVTASTGIAATHLGGVTVHAWSGVGVRTVIDDAALERIREFPFVVRRVQEAKVLVIDEVSMLPAATLDAVDTVCRALRGDARPFGGMQVVFVGDFFQLPPVRRDDESEPLPASSLDDFAFNARAWREAKPVVCYLGEQHRQRDESFLGLLDAMRRRDVGRDHRHLLDARRGREPLAGAVWLYAHNADVDRINAAELEKVPGAPREFVMESKGPPGLVQALTRGCTSPERLAVKKGAKVVFTRNDPEGRWVNGTLGVVTGFDADTDFPVVRTRAGDELVAEPVTWSYEDDEKVLAGITQVPLRLAWALTVHKSQGMSLDAAHVDLGRAFAYGQGYVALSRVRTLEGLTLEGYNARALEVHPGVAAMDRTFRAKSEALRARFEALAPEDVATRQRDFVVTAGGVVPKPRSAPKGVAAAVAKAPPKNPRKAAKKPSPAPVGPRTERRWDQSVELLRAGNSLEQAAAARGRNVETILSHLENAAARNILRMGDLAALARAEATMVAAVRDALATLRTEKLRDVGAHLGGRYTAEQLRLARLLVRYG